MKEKKEEVSFEVKTWYLFIGQCSKIEVDNTSKDTLLFSNFQIVHSYFIS